MNSRLAHSNDAVRRAGRATRYLLLIALALMVVLAGLFGYLSLRQSAMEDSIREDALWAVYQLDRETRSLGQLLRDRDATAQEISLRYDILYSRLSILSNTRYAPYFELSSTFHAHRQHVRDVVLGLEADFDAFAASGAFSQEQNARIVQELSGLAVTTGEFLTFTNAVMSASRAEARERIMYLQRLAAAAVLALLLTIGLLVYNLARQVRSLKQASSELEATANELSEAYKLADAGNRAKSEFMATISHEIRTPLNAILGMAELLSRSELEPGERRQVEVIASSGNTLLEIINEVLDFAKLEHGSLCGERVAFDPQELVTTCVRMLEPKAREQGNEILVSVTGLAPGDMRVSDPTLVRRVLINLLSNAVKFTENGKVKLALTGTEDRLRFEVVDTGIGIAADSQSLLFQPFSQVDGSISRRFGGTGLGLAISKRICEELGGKIGLESVQGIGSRFWFEVPVKTAPARASQPEAGPVRDVPSLNVLVVEDQEFNREVAGRFLQLLGQEVTFAKDGVEGVKLATENDFDLILMDMQMPVMDGIEATRTLRASGRTVPIIAMTANASDSDRRACTEAGMDGFEAKPIRIEQLRNLILSFGSKEAPAASAGEHSGRASELIGAIGEDGYRKLLEMFTDEVVVLLNAVHAALNDKDSDRLDRALHSLKGAALNMGLVDVAESAESLRKRSLDEVDIAQIQALIDRSINPVAA